MGTTTKTLRLAGSDATDARVRAAINNFGIEYELFPNSWRNRLPRETASETAPRPDTPAGWPSIYQSMTGQDILSVSDWLALARRTNQFRSRRAARTDAGGAPWSAHSETEGEAATVYRTATNTLRGAGGATYADPMATPMVLVRRAHEAGLIAEDCLHGYHCHCETCAPRRAGTLMTAQTDSSVAVEFVSRILTLESEHDVSEVARWVALMEQWKADGGWMPDGRECNGDHIHVERGAVDYRHDRAFSNMLAMYAVFDWTRVADGGCGQIRGYNAKPSRDGGGSWLGDRGYGTFEHRLWNTPRDPERLWAHVGISIAMTRWAASLAMHSADCLYDIGTSTSWGGARMSEERFTFLANHRDDLIEAISAHLPDFDHRDYAARVLDNLAVY